MSYGNLVYGGVQTPSMTEMGAFMANGAVHRAVHTPGLHGDMGNLVYGADEGGTEVSMIDQVMAHLKEYWAWYTGGAIALAAAVYYMQKPRTLANRRKRKSKGHGRKGKRRLTKKQSDALAMGRARAGKRRGKKARKSTVSRGRKVSAYSKAWGRFRKMGYSASEAARLAKGGKARGQSRKGKGRSRR